jgi:hypothetical protein
MSTVIMFWTTLVPFASAGFDPPAAASRPVAIPAELKELQSLIGTWNATATPLEKNGRRGRNFTRQEATWQWRVEKSGAALICKFAEGKLFRTAELTFNADAESYSLKLVDESDKSTTFTGKREGKKIVLDASAGGRWTLDLPGPDRMVLTRFEKAGKRFIPSLEIGGTRKGAAFAAKSSGPECIVTGGLGTMTVVHKGKTYYVCCSGCKEAFEEDPEKYIAEAKMKKR